jgi:hypothetical protein
MIPPLQPPLSSPVYPLSAPKYKRSVSETLTALPKSKRQLAKTSVKFIAINFCRGITKVHKTSLHVCFVYKVMLNIITTVLSSFV